MFFSVHCCDKREDFLRVAAGQVRQFYRDIITGEVCALAPTADLIADAAGSVQSHIGREAREYLRGLNQFEHFWCWLHGVPFPKNSRASYATHRTLYTR